MVKEEEMILNLGKIRGWEHCIWRSILLAISVMFTPAEKANFNLLAEQIGGKKMWIETSEKYGDKGKERLLSSLPQ